jgi:regulatory protein
MGTITALRVNTRKERVNVFVDGLFSFTIAEELRVIHHLEVGQNLSDDQINELRKKDLYFSCMEAAVHYLSYRPRSESEVGRRLKQRGFDYETVQEVISKLKEQQLIDDVSFSQFWRNNRLAFSPRSTRLIRLELRQKGVAAETVNEVLKDLNDEDSVYEAGLKKAHRLTGSDYDDFRRLLYDYLRRRGYSYETVKRAIERLWEQRKRSYL